MFSVVYATAESIGSILGPDHLCVASQSIHIYLTVCVPTRKSVVILHKIIDIIFEGMSCLYSWSLFIFEKFHLPDVTLCVKNY
jgi:hypothetical protein